MLRNRVITAVILAPIFVAAVLYLPVGSYAVFFWCVAALGAHEWAGFMDLSALARWLYVALFGLAALALYLFADATAYAVVLWLGAAWWALAILAVLAFPRGAALFRNRWLLGIVGLDIVVFAWVALLQIKLEPQGGAWLIWLFVLVWGADIGAYFAGRAFGSRKLAPSVSPGKTWEGAAGGALLAAAVCGAGLLFFPVRWPVWMALSLVLVGVSIFGDLFESVVKRATGVKDSGTILPGHGGVLDRIDSLLAVLPVFALLLIYAVGMPS